VLKNESDLEEIEKLVAHSKKTAQASAQSCSRFLFHAMAYGSIPTSFSY
jgi:hypothetical protein